MFVAFGLLPNTTQECTLRYTGGAIPTTQGHPTTRPSTTEPPTVGGLDSHAPGQHEGQVLVLFSAYTDCFNSFPVQIS